MRVIHINTAKAALASAIQKTKRNNTTKKNNKKPFFLKIPVSNQGNQFITSIRGSDHEASRAFDIVETYGRTSLPYTETLTPNTKKPLLLNIPVSIHAHH